jgi:hypothetical protein
LRGHFDQVQIRFLGQPEGVVDADDADLLAVRSDESDLRDADAVVDAWLGVGRGAARVGADGASSVRGSSARPWLAQRPGNGIKPRCPGKFPDTRGLLPTDRPARWRAPKHSGNRW